MVKLHESAKNDALVIAPRCATVVGACVGVGGIQAVVDEILRIDHAGVLEPRPLLPRPIQVSCRGASRCAVGEFGRDRKEDSLGMAFL